MNRSEIPTNLTADLELEDIEEVIKTGTDLRQYSKEIEKKLRESEKDIPLVKHKVGLCHRCIGWC